MHHYLIRIKTFYKYKNKYYRVYKFGKSNKDFEEQRINSYNGCNKCEEILTKIEFKEDIESYFLAKLRKNNNIHFIRDLGKEYFIIIKDSLDQENDVNHMDNYLLTFINFSLFNLELLYK